MIFCMFFFVFFMSYFHQLSNQNYYFFSICFSLLHKTPINYYINFVPLKEKNSISCKLPFPSFVLCMLYLYCVYQIS